MNMHPFSNYQGLGFRKLLETTQAADPALHQTLQYCADIFCDDARINIEHDEILLIEDEGVDLCNIDLTCIGQTEKHICFEHDESSARSEIMFMKSPNGHHVLLHIETERGLEYDDNGNSYYNDLSSRVSARIGTEEQIRGAYRKIMSDQIYNIEFEISELVTYAENIIEYIETMGRDSRISHRKMARLSIINSRLMSALINAMPDAQT